MLVLSRFEGESIIINGNIRVTIASIRTHNMGVPCEPKVRIGVDAPRDVTVHRQEVHLAILRDATQAADAACGEQGE